MRVYVTVDELFPVYFIDAEEPQQLHYTVDLPDSFVEHYKKCYADFSEALDEMKGYVQDLLTKYRNEKSV